MNSRATLERRVQLLALSTVVPLSLIVPEIACSSRPVSLSQGSITGDRFALSEPSSSQPLTAAMNSSSPEVVAGERFEIVVRIKIAAAHHIYASNLVDKPFIPATVDLALPRGVETLGDWSGPEPTRARNGAFIYVDSVVLRRPLRIRANVPSGVLSIKGELHYQACTEELCWPPRTIKLVASIQVRPARR